MILRCHDPRPPGDSAVPQGRKNAAHCREDVRHSASQFCRPCRGFVPSDTPGPTACAVGYHITPLPGLSDVGPPTIVGFALWDDHRAPSLPPAIDLPVSWPAPGQRFGSPAGTKDGSPGRQRQRQPGVLGSSAKSLAPAGAKECHALPSGSNTSFVRILSPLPGLALLDALQPTACAVGYPSYAPAGALPCESFA